MEKPDGGESRSASDDTVPHFPVTLFWIACRAEWFEDYVIQHKRELRLPMKEDQH